MIDTFVQTGAPWPESLRWQACGERAVEAAVAASGHAALANTATLIEVAIRLTSDEDIQRLNAEYRGKDKPTNVLSFPMLEILEIGSLATNAMPEVLLGDIVLAHGVCAREAEAKGVSLAAHVTHLIIHGMLHLLGYDHLEEGEAEDMEALEIVAMAALGLHHPYDG